MIDKTHFRIPTAAVEKLDNLAASTHSHPATEQPIERLDEVEKRLALFEEMLFDCAMTLKDKVADRLDQLEDLCHHETAQLRQECQQGEYDRKKELNLLTLKISEAIDRIAAEKNRPQQPDENSVARFPELDSLPTGRKNDN